MKRKNREINRGVIKELSLEKWAKNYDFLLRWDCMSQEVGMVYRKIGVELYIDDQGKERYHALVEVSRVKKEYDIVQELLGKLNNTYQKRESILQDLLHR
jgi:hypothetical protein